MLFNYYSVSLSEYVSVRLDAAAALLGEVTGLDSPEEVLNRVFSSFCIGK